MVESCWSMDFFLKIAWMVGVLSRTGSREFRSSTMLVRDEYCDHGYWLGHQMKVDAIHDGFVWLPIVNVVIENIRASCGGSYGGQTRCSPCY